MATKKTDEQAATVEQPPAEEQIARENKTPPVDEAFTIARVLKVTKPLIRGDDVKAVQEKLIAAGYGCGTDGANGVYNTATAAAVRHFQSMKRVIVNGKVDKFTAQALGVKWKEPEKVTK